LVCLQFQPSMSLAPGETRRLDVVHAAGSQYQLELEIFSDLSMSTGSPVASCRMYMIAMDGMYLDAVRLTNFIPLAPGQRASLLLTCYRTGIFFLQSRPNNRTRVDFAPDHLRYTQNLVTLIVSGAQKARQTAPDLTAISRCAPLLSLD
jgi:hypothetical protein